MKKKSYPNGRTYYKTKENNGINKNPNILIVILNWNGWLNTIECLESIFQNNYINYDVVLVDNNSDDNSIDYIKDYCAGKIKIDSKYIEQQLPSPSINLFEFTKKESQRILNSDQLIVNNKKLIIIKNDENYGFCEGNNIGIRFGLKNLDPDYFLILNNDVVFNNDFLENLITYHQDKNFALSQPKILSYNSRNIINSTGGLADKFGTGMPRGYDELDKGQYDYLQKNDFFYALGTCLLATKKFIIELNPEEFFDKSLFAAHEDFDVSWQARMLGHEIHYCPKVVCYHKGHQSFKNQPKLTFNALLMRNKFRILIKNYSLIYLIVFLPVAVLIEFIVSLSLTITHKNLEFFKLFLKGIVWNLKKRHDTINKRKKIQEKRKISDSQITKSMKNISMHYYWIKRG